MAHHKQLPSDATLASVYPLLRAPVDFVPAVFGLMNRAEKDHGSTRLRLGVTGTGKLPNYRLETSDGALIEVYDGNNHQPWTEGSVAAQEVNWSTAAMTFEELKDMLRTVRESERAAR